MKKKLLSLALLAGLLLSSLTGCGSSGEDDSALDTTDSTKTATITLTAITGDSTTADTIQAVQDAMNKLTKSEYKTQVILQLKTEDEYEAFIEDQVAQIEADIAAEEEAAAKAKEEAKARKEAEKAANAAKKNRSKWTTTTTAETEETTADTQEMTLDEYGREVAKYPELEGASLDIVFITGREMLEDFVEKEYLQDISSELSGNSKILNKYIYPTFLNAGKVDGSTYAVVKYNFAEAEDATTLADCEAFLDAVKAGEPDVVPLNEAVDLNYVQYCSGERSLVGSMIKANHTTTVKSIPKNLLGIESFVTHNILLEKLEDGGYIGEGERYAVEVRKGYITTPEEENWEEKYYVVEYEKPICSDEVVFSGMFAISAYASDLERCMEIVTMLNTDGALRDIYAFGVEGENFEYNEDGTVHMLNDDWSMDFYHTGNTLVGSVPETLPANYADIAKLQNVETLTSPYFTWEYEITEENEAAYEEYLAAAAGYLAEFDAAADKAAFAEALVDELKGDTENIVTKMLGSDYNDSLLNSYADFYSEQNPS